ncbi:hypothetical protein AN643_01945 [Candidatus Epulonipiscioides saccharophilum]|nr:hypothetical protein AN643_01945 [Epulopiscium sp. SCG-B10WGA-EpuloB]
MCHYILDTVAHPYVFYIGGKYIKTQPNTYRYKGFHRKIESGIDYLLLEEYFGLKANKFKIHKNILKNKTVANSILKLYEYSLYNTYHIKHGGKIFSDSYSQFRNYFILTFDSFGLKKLIAKVIAPILPKGIVGFVDSCSYYKCADPNFDYLNLSKSVWRHPVTGHKYYLNFFEILDLAYASISEILVELNNVFYGQNHDDISKLYDMIPNYSYSSGLDVSDRRPFKYAIF